MPDQSDESHEVEVITTEQQDLYSDSEDSEDSDPDETLDESFNITRPTRAGRERVFTSRMRYFLEHK